MTTKKRMAAFFIAAGVASVAVIIAEILEQRREREIEILYNAMYREEVI